MDGALVINKQAGMTSHDVVAVARRLLGERRIGHIGTLDPFATGVLVLLIGRATRLARFYAGRDKTYQGRIRFGFATDTMDRTGLATGPDQNPVLDAAELRRLFSEFVGKCEQRPPVFSAKKVSGVPAYRLARSGRDVKLETVCVTIHRLELLSTAGPFAEFEAEVSSGTYIRSLVQDLGESLGKGAHLVDLHRTRLGEFTEHDALSLQEVGRRLEQRTLALISLEALLPDIPEKILTADQARLAENGRHSEHVSEAQYLRLLGPEGQLCAIAERSGENLFHPIVVLTTEHCGGLVSAAGTSAASC